MYLSISESAAIIGVSVSTLRRWDKNGLLHPDQYTLGGHRRYKLVNLMNIFNEDVQDDQDKLIVGYARVSSFDQKRDLKRQKEKITRYCQELSQTTGQKYEIISELGSGLNFRKRGLKKVTISPPKL